MSAHWSGSTSSVTPSRSREEGPTMSNTAPAVPQLVAANHFQLAGHHLHITYSPFVEAGLPSFTYQDAHQTQTFRGADIQSAATEAGTLVSVVIRRTVDAGSTTFSIL